MNVTVIHLMSTLMERQLDESAGWLLKSALEARGQTILTGRSEEHTSELQSLMRISYAVFCLKKKKHKTHNHTTEEYVTQYKTQHHQHFIVKTTHRLTADI